MSAFWGESFIGTFKKLVKSPKKPLTQIVNRLNELESTDRLKIKKRNCLSACKIDEKSTVIIHEGRKFQQLASININGGTFTPTHPNNIAQLRDNKIFKIKNMYKLFETETAKCMLRVVYFTGYVADGTKNFFDYPTPSLQLGIVSVNSFESQERTITAGVVKNKCVFLHVSGQSHAVPFQHI